MITLILVIYCKKQEPERIYQIVYGKVLCAGHKVDYCGVSLYDCADARTYECLQNVFYEK